MKRSLAFAALALAISSSAAAETLPSTPRSVATWEVWVDGAHRTTYRIRDKDVLLSIPDSGWQCTAKAPVQKTHDGARFESSRVVCTMGSGHGAMLSAECSSRTPDQSSTFGVVSPQGGPSYVIGIKCAPTASTLL
jgi:hypothetical protein